jgi:hypothetical protein
MALERDDCFIDCHPGAMAFSCDFIHPSAFRPACNARRSILSKGQSRAMPLQPAMRAKSHQAA